MADQQILREYLVALGFRVDESGERKFDNTLHSLDKKSAVLGKTLVGVGAAAVTLSTVFAKSMERLYYSARYADTTVSRLQELEYAGRQVGLQGGQATAALKGMASALRGNPGLMGLLEKIGVPVKGRTMDQVMIDFVKATKSMPFAIGQRYASLFGIDPETLFNLQQGIDKMEQAQEARRAMAADLGVDSDKTAEVAKTYMNMWREVTERAGLFGQAIGELVLPKVQELVGTTNDLMKDWVKIAREINASGTSDFWKKIREGATGRAEGDRVELSPDAKKRLGTPMYDVGDLDEVDPALGHVPRWKRLLKRFAPKQFDKRVASDPDAVDAVQDQPAPVKQVSEAERVKLMRERLEAGDTSPGGKNYASVDDIDKPLAGNPALEGDDLSVKGTDEASGTDPSQFLASLEKRYALPPGVLDRVWLRESSRGRNMRSPKGALGHFGFMPATAKEYGVKDPNDFKESASAAARKFADLMKHYHGDLKMAAAAYNWGEGHLDRYGLGMAPKETQDYVKDVAGGAQEVNLNTNINIHGVHDPDRAANLAAGKQREIASDVIRNMKPKVR